MKLLTAAEFHNKWLENNEDTFLIYNNFNIKSLNLGGEDEKILQTSGIPEWVAPNIYFYVPDNIDPIEERFFPFGEDALDRKICIDKKSGRVIIAKDYPVVQCLMNSSLCAMCTALFCYMNMVDDAININGENAFTERNMPKNLVEKFRTDMGNYDPLAMKKGAFWYDELNRLTN